MRTVSLFASLALFVAGCAATSAPVPATHHDAFVEKWIGKSKEALIGSLGQPSRNVSMPTGESTLVWDKPRCYVAFDTDKRGIITSGVNDCGTAKTSGP